MNRALNALVGSALAFALSTSCGAPDTHESVTTEAIGCMTELAALLDGVTDKASALAAKPNLEALTAKMKDLAARTESLGEPDAETKQQLEQRFQEAMADTSLMQSLMRLATVPEALEVLDDVMQQLNSDG